MTALLARRVEALEAHSPNANNCFSFFVRYISPGAAGNQAAYERKAVGIRAAPRYGLPAIDMEPGEESKAFQDRVSALIVWPPNCTFAILYMRCADDPKEAIGEKADLEQLRALASIRLD